MDSHKEMPLLAEPVRLVIWDLDDTFWKGTLSEAPVEFVHEHRMILRELARRGILNSICTRNDPQRVRATLLDEGLWDYFVFPSIGWESKGPRIRTLIERSQLRPASVLLIDDNPSNLQEARHFTPELAIAGPQIIAGMLDHPAFVGSPDPELTRLLHYKSLERRQADAQSAVEDSAAFLRNSDIRVCIHHELDMHLERIVELINRTNQLNFTKRRLPEGAAARIELGRLLHSHEMQAGLLEVRDRYGHHGQSGFYLLHNSGELLQFCFSCRLLGLGIETWLYRRLGRPRLDVVGEVLADPMTDERTVDWITLDPAPSATEANGAPAASGVPRTAASLKWVFARGGCDLQALSHYFRTRGAQVHGEFNTGRQGLDVRLDHSACLHHALYGLSDAARQAAMRLGYRDADFVTALSDPDRCATADHGVVILSFWADAAYALYRHRTLQFLVPFALPGRANHALDARTASPSELPPHLRSGEVAQALSALQADYDFVGLIDEATFKAHVARALDALPAQTPAVLLLANTRLWDAQAKVMHQSAACMRLNTWVTEAAAHRARTVLVDVREAIQGEHEVLDWSHFDRIVYFRLYRRICERLADCTGAGA